MPSLRWKFRQFINLFGQLLLRAPKVNMTGFNSVKQAVLFWAGPDVLWQTCKHISFTKRVQDKSIWLLKKKVYLFIRRERPGGILVSEVGAARLHFHIECICLKLIKILEICLPGLFSQVRKTEGEDVCTFKKILVTICSLIVLSSTIKPSKVFQYFKR